jgi:formyltetrahydrofolate-dependent phosphoribosylglycinamide formyltransferase
MRSRIAVLVSGGGSNLQAILDYFKVQGEARSADIALVISDRPGAFALERARKAGIENQVIPHSDGNALCAALQEREVDLVVLAGYLRRLPPNVIRDFRNRIVNIHPGPLPKFGGAGMYGERVHAAVIEAGLTETAVTVHLVEEEYDTGAIVAQWPVPVLDGDTAETLARRVLEVEHALYPRVIDFVLALNSLNTIQTH